MTKNWKNRFCPHFFDQIFWPLDGARLKFWRSEVLSWVKFSGEHKVLSTKKRFFWTMPSAWLSLTTTTSTSSCFYIASINSKSIFKIVWVLAHCSSCVVLSKSSIHDMIFVCKLNANFHSCFISENKFSRLTLISCKKTIK